MSLPERTGELIRSLQATTALLQKLQQALKSRRMVWVAAKPREIAAPLQDLEPIAEELKAETSRRDQLLTALAVDLPLPAPRPGCDLQVSMGMIARHLPAPQARTLQAATQDAVKAARSVRIETALGSKLLHFARAAHDSWLPHLAGLGQGPQGYDRNARNRTLTTAPRGALIDGRL